MNATRRRARLRERCLSALRALHDPLFADLQEATRRFGEVLAQAKLKVTYTASLDQELKVLLRCFFAFVEGVTGSMREAATTPTLVPSGLIPAKGAEALRLFDRVTAAGARQPRRTATAERVKLALKYFPLAFGSDHQANFNPPGWPAFKRLVKLRNRITHPVRIENLFPAEALAVFQPAVNWFLGEIHHEMTLAMDSVVPGGLSRPHNIPPSLVLPEIKPAEAVFDKAFYESVELSGANAIAYMRAVHKLLHEELRFSLGLIADFQARVIGEEHGTGFALRCAVRSAVSVLEGLAGMTLLFLRAAVRRGEVVLDDGVLAAAERDSDPLRQLRTCLELYSMQFGVGHPISTATARWRGMERLVAQRHRLIHPRSPSDLEVSAGTIEDLISLLAVFIEDVSEALHLNEQGT